MSCSSRENRRSSLTLFGVAMALHIGLSIYYSMFFGSVARPRNTSVPETTRQIALVWPPPKQLQHLVGNGPKRLVVLASNADYVEFADNLAQSLQQLNVFNFAIVPLDQPAFTALSTVYPRHTLPLHPNHSHLKPQQNVLFGSEAFRELTSTRPVFLRPFLEQGYDVFYNDIDIVWREDVWTVLDRLLSGNSDHNYGLFWHDGPGQLCSCMMWLQASSNRSLTLIDQWKDEIDRGEHTTDQFAFIDLAKSLRFPFGGGSRDGVKVIKDFQHFPTGKHFPWNSPNSSRAVMVHSNWVTGKDAKRQRLVGAGLWHPSGLLVEAKR